MAQVYNLCCAENLKTEKSYVGWSLPTIFLDVKKGNFGGIGLQPVLGQAKACGYILFLFSLIMQKPFGHLDY